jgi:transposase
MDSKELYTSLLGLRAPWVVESVVMDMAKLAVSVRVAHPPRSRFACPQCGDELPVADHATERQWRHLDSCQFMTLLIARPPRVECPQHGKLQVVLPWAESGSRFTNMFEALAIEVLQASNVKRAAALLRLTWDEAWGVMERAVARGQAEKAAHAPTQVGVDEKAIAKGHKYMTLVGDTEKSTVEYVSDNRTEESLAGYFAQLTPEQREAIQSVSMDMWPAYMNATLAAVPGAEDKIVFDRFHIMQHASRALDKVRRRENKELREDGDDRLVRSRYLWLQSKENLSDAAIDRFADLRSSNLKTARAWAIKESLREVWDCRCRTDAKEFFRRWYFWATHSRLAPMIELARTVQRHIHNVLTYYLHPVTNAVVEGLNSKIAGIQKRSCGFRNRDHFKIAVYFHCGGLNLYPAAVTPGKV